MSATKKIPVILIGIAGAGKSTVGSILAKKLDFQFIDTDRVMEARFRKNLDTILEEIGPEEFSKQEGQIFLECLGEKRVLAPGGSVVYHRDAMERAKSSGFVVWLYLSLEEWWKRIGGQRPRGFLLLSSTTLKDEFAVREKLYRQHAHIKVDATLHPDTIALEIFKAYSKGWKG